MEETQAARYSQQSQPLTARQPGREYGYRVDAPIARAGRNGSNAGAVVQTVAMEGHYVESMVD